MKAEGIMVKLLDEAEIEVDPSMPTDADQFEDLEDGGDEGEGNGGTADEDEEEKKPREGGGDTASGSEGTYSDGNSSPKKGKGKVKGSSSEGKASTKGSKRKLLPATYEPDKRAMSWLKVKKDYME
jgi:DNA ligase-1